MRISFIKISKGLLLLLVTRASGNRVLYTLPHCCVCTYTRKIIYIIAYVCTYIVYVQYKAGNTLRHFISVTQSLVSGYDTCNSKEYIQHNIKNYKICLVVLVCIVLLNQRFYTVCNLLLLGRLFNDL